MPALVHRVAIESIRPVDRDTPKRGRTLGHEFQLEIDVDDVSQCVLQWWEKASVPYDNAMRAGEWVDMFTARPDSPVFNEWHFQTRHVPVGRTIFTLRDPPGIMADETKARELYFEIRVRGAATQRGLRAHQRIIVDTTSRGRDVNEFVIRENDLALVGHAAPTW